MCSICTPGVDDAHNYLKKFRQKLHLSSDIWFFINIMTGMDRNDILFALSGSIWSCITIRKNDTSTEENLSTKTRT